MEIERKLLKLLQKINLIDYKLTKEIQNNANEFRDKYFDYDANIFDDTYKKGTLEYLYKKELEFQFDYTNLYEYDQKEIYDKMISFLLKKKETVYNKKYSKNKKYDFVDINTIKVKYEPEIPFIAMSLLNRFLSIQNYPEKISKDKMYILIYASIIIAVKYEEKDVPNFPYISKKYNTRFGAFREIENIDDDDVNEIKDLMLKTNNWNFIIPTPLNFLEFYSKIANFSGKQKFIAVLICESSLTSFDTLKFLPSVIAATAVYITRKEMGIVPNWNFQLFYYTKLTEKDLEECYNVLNKLKDEMEFISAFKEVYDNIATNEDYRLYYYNLHGIKYNKNATVLFKKHFLKKNT